jgi:DNA-binding beta-propeller fold protein YncE
LTACATLAAILISITGCAAPGLQQEEAYHPVWPPPPAAPRIGHVMDIRTPNDLHKPSMFDGLGKLLTGGGTQAILRPNSVTVVGDGLLCVTDQECQGVHLLPMRSGKSRFVSEAREGLHFVSPVGVAAFGDRIAVSDSALNRVFLITRDGKPAGEVEKPGGFARPTGLAYDTEHHELYVVDTLANEVCVFDRQGNLVRRFGSPGTEPEQFNFPTHVFVSRNGRVFVTDSMNFRVQAFDREGKYLFELGAHGDASGYLSIPKGVGVDSHGHIYIVDSHFSNVQVFDAEGRFLLSIGGPGSKIGEFQVPSGLFVGHDDRVYICDSYNRRVQVLEYLAQAGAEDTP